MAIAIAQHLESALATVHAAPLQGAGLNTTARKVNRHGVRPCNPIWDSAAVFDNRPDRLEALVMTMIHLKYQLVAILAAAFVFAFDGQVPSFAQDQATADQASVTQDDAAPLSEEEMEILVARIALYPDELVALICGASLFPLQIVEAARFLDDYEKDNSLQPKDSWDGSVVSLLNYPEIVAMMSDDLEWTQELGDALAYQQKDVLIAVQQLRDQAVANGIIQSDDKMEVVEEDDNIVIKSTSAETIYVPQYEPEMLYVADYPPAPIAYYPTPYPHYYYPTATFFAGAVTGAIWAAAVDWNDWGVWGGGWNGGNVNIDCNNCFNNRNFNGKVNINDVDWKNVDRNKINIDKDQFNKIDRTNIRNDIESNRNNSIGNKAANIKKERPSTLPANAGGSRDVRKSVQEGLKGGGKDVAAARPGGDRPAARPGNANKPSRPAGSASLDNVKKPTSRPSGAKKPGAKVDNRPKKPSGLGNVSKGKPNQVASKRGAKSMGGGSRGGGGAHKSVKRGGGGRRR
jgi:Protein of unknown function (DUF3300)